MDRTCVKHRRSPENHAEGPSVRLKRDPNVWGRPSRRNPRNETGLSFVQRLLRPGERRDSSSSLLLNRQRRRLRWGRVESAPLMRASSGWPDRRYIASDDEKAGRATVGSGPGVQGSPQQNVSRHLPRRQLERRVYARRKGRVIFWSGGGSQPVAAPDSCSPCERYLRSLGRWPSCVLSISLTAPVLLWFTDVLQILGCLRHRNVIQHKRASQLDRVTSLRIVPESAKGTPHSVADRCYKVARLRSYEYESARTSPLITAVMVHTGCENSMRNWVTGMICDGQLISVIIVSQTRGWTMWVKIRLDRLIFW